MKIRSYNLNSNIELKQHWDHLHTNSLAAFMKTPYMASMWQLCANEGQKLRAKFKRLVILGLGGSGLTARVFADLWDDHSQLFIVDNSDPDLIAKSIAWIKSHENESVGYLLISKSGTTVETLFAYDCLVANLEQVVSNTIVVTDYNNNELFTWAKTNRIPTFEIPAKVGGRFSALTPVGLLPAAFLGRDLNQIRLGAETAIQNTDYSMAFASAALASFAAEKWITLFFLYSSSLKNLGGWVSQLWAESLAKASTRKGSSPAPRVSTPLAAIGSSDHHSLLQQFLEGSLDKWFVFIAPESFQFHLKVPSKYTFSPLSALDGRSSSTLLTAQQGACAEALIEKGIPVTEIGIPDLSAKSVGNLLMFFEICVGLIGEALDINAYDQPGVERVKVITRNLLSGSAKP